MGLKVIIIGEQGSGRTTTARIVAQALRLARFRVDVVDGEEHQPAESLSAQDHLYGRLAGSSVKVETRQATESGDRIQEEGESWLRAQTRHTAPNHVDRPR